MLHGGGYRVVDAPRLSRESDSRVYQVFDANADNVATITARIREGEVHFDPSLREAIGLIGDDRSENGFGEYTGYHRIADDLKEPLFRDETVLAELAEVMASAPVSKGRHRLSAVGIPAAYTYLGQIIAHDLSQMEFETSGGRNYRTPRLDFDSFFGKMPRISPAASTACAAGLALGQTTSGKFDDIPRANDGTPYLADDRNDHNLTLSQLTVLITKFFQVVDSKIGDPDEAREVAKRHLQWLVLFDYLPRVIDPVIYDDVLRTGQWPVLGEENSLIPLEFALASFRIGHAMPRFSYQPWRDGGGWAELTELLDFTGHSPNSRLQEISGEKRLPSNWLAGWEQLVKLTHSSPYVVTASLLDEGMAGSMFELPSSLTSKVLSPNAHANAPNAPEPETFNLAMQTLLRGNRMFMPSAQTLHQTVCERLNAAGAVQLPKYLDFPKFRNTRSSDLSKFLEGKHTLWKAGPIWFYMLREAEVEAAGQRFGPLASRINMETIYRAIAQDFPPLNKPTFQLNFANTEGRFCLATLVEFVSKNWTTNLLNGRRP